MDQQELKRFSALSRIIAHADDIDLIKSFDDPAIVRLGLICTVYFLNGGQPAVREAVLSCFDRFYAEFSEHLTGQFYGDQRRFTGLKKDSFSLRRERLAAEDPSSDGGLFWLVQSQKKGDFAADYCIETVTTMTANDEFGALSYIKIVLPWQLLETEAGQACYLRWVHDLADSFEVVHGYGGLSPILPYDRHAYQPYELNLAEYFSGLMIDSSPHLEKRHLKQHIKGINWLTLLSPKFVAKLGDENTLRQRLEAEEDVTVSKSASGVMIIQAGVLPELGAPENGLPPAYVAVNRIIKPIRIPDPDQLHTQMDDAVGFTKNNTLAWYERFDDVDPPITHLAPSTPLIAPSLYRVDALKPCPKAGFWYAPIQQGSRSWFELGDIMPDFPNATLHGSTIWYREGRDDE